MIPSRCRSPRDPTFARVDAGDEGQVGRRQEEDEGDHLLDPQPKNTCHCVRNAEAKMPGSDKQIADRRARRRRAAAAPCEGGFRGGREHPPRWCVSAPLDLILRPTDLDRCQQEQQQTMERCPLASRAPRGDPITRPASPGAPRRPPAADARSRRPSPRPAPHPPSRARGCRRRARVASSASSAARHGPSARRARKAWRRSTCAFSSSGSMRRRSAEASAPSSSNRFTPTMTRSPLSTSRWNR